jgi:hypothetical protein
MCCYLLLFTLSYTDNYAIHGTEGANQPRHSPPPTGASMQRWVAGLSTRDILFFMNYILEYRTQSRVRHAFCQRCILAPE